MGQALSLAQTASTTVQPLVPIMQATSSTGTTISLLWNIIPVPVKILLGVVLVVALCALGFKVYERVKKMHGAYKFDARLGKRDVDGRFLESYCDWLIRSSRDMSAQSRVAYEARDKVAGMAMGSAAASYLALARWLMPKRTLAQVPGCDKMISVLDEALRHRVGRGVPHLEIVFHAENEVKK
jgi:hypothetical protein